MWRRLRSHQNLESRAWLAALCLYCCSCTPIKDPTPKLEDSPKTTDNSTKAQPDDRDAATGGRASHDAGMPPNERGTNIDTQHTARDNHAGNPAKDGGDDTTGGTAAPPVVPDAGVMNPKTDPSMPDVEDDSFVPRTDPPGDTETVLAAETADADSLKRLAQWNQLPVFAPGNYREQNAQDRGTGSPSEMAVWPSLADGERDVNNFICRGAEGTIGQGTVPYLYDQASCPEKYVRGVEMARFTGSGRMIRLWMTVTGLSPGTQVGDEWLRIYVDDNPRPIVQLRVDQVLGGAPDEIFVPPFGSGARSTIAWHYPVVFSSKLVVVLDHLSNNYFYEVDAVTDEAPQHRVAGGKRRNGRDAAQARLASPSPVPMGAVLLGQESIMLGANQQHHVELTGPATIEEMVLRVPQDKLSTLSGVHITGRWDDATTAAIDVPLLSLFAAAFAVPNPGSLALTSRVEDNDLLLSLRLPMPFRSKAAWDLNNAGSDGAAFTLTWNGEAVEPDQPHGHLNVQFHEAAVPLSSVEQNIATVKGRGRLVGVCADIVGKRESSVLGSSMSSPMDFCRSDVYITVDGTLAMQSTATDHYADNGVYFADSPRSTPFGQTWNRVVNDADDQGQISFCRWHVLGNEIDFKSSLGVMRHVAQRDPSIIKLHRTVAYVYVE